jgi:hypothetical protein
MSAEYKREKIVEQDSTENQEAAELILSGVGRLRNCVLRPVLTMEGIGDGTAALYM